MNKTDMKRYLSFFQNSYDSCRKAFIDQVMMLREKKNGVLFSSIEVPSDSAHGLFIDWCLVPPYGQRKNLVILTSGIHGVEGYTGSAVQQFVMSELMNEMDNKETGYLFIHGINPYGFRTNRRVTGNNVDLNRNFDVSGEIFAPGNGNRNYADLHAYLNLRRPARTGIMNSLGFFFSTFFRLFRRGMKPFREAVSRGQYEFGDGIYFGGHGPEPQKELLGPLFKLQCGHYERVFAIDLHTGYGGRGTLHFFPDIITDSRILMAMKEVFRGFPIDSGDKESFYRITGEFISYIGELFPDVGLFIPMTFEYGTVNNHRMISSILSLHRTVLENQLAHYGAVDEKTAERIRSSFLEEFYPSDKNWREAVIKTTADVLPVLVERFSLLPLSLL